MGRTVHEDDWVLCCDGRVGRVEILLDDLPEPYVFVSFPTGEDLIGYRPNEVQAVSPLEALASAAA